MLQIILMDVCNLWYFARCLKCMIVVCLGARTEARQCQESANIPWHYDLLLLVVNAHVMHGIHAFSYRKWNTLFFLI